MPGEPSGAFCVYAAEFRDRVSCPVAHQVYAGRQVNHAIGAFDRTPDSLGVLDTSPDDLLDGETWRLRSHKAADVIATCLQVVTDRAPEKSGSARNEDGVAQTLQLQ